MAIFSIAIVFNCGQPDPDEHAGRFAKFYHEHSRQIDRNFASARFVMDEKVFSADAKLILRRQFAGFYKWNYALYKTVRHEQPASFDATGSPQPQIDDNGLSIECINPDYRFTISRPSGIYNLDMLKLRPTDVFLQAEIADFVGLLPEGIRYSDIGKRKDVKVIRFEPRELNSTQCEVLVLDIATDAAKVVEGLECEVWFAQDDARVMQICRRSASSTKEKLVLFEYTGEGPGRRPKSKKVIIADSKSKTQQLVSEKHYLEFEPSFEVPERECFVSAYGFVEPPGIVRSPSWFRPIMVVIAVSTGAYLLLYLVRLRKK